MLKKTNERGITMQIKVLKTKNCRAELAQLIFEEIGIDSKIVIGKIKLPIELESKVLENQWIVIFGEKVSISLGMQLLVTLDGVHELNLDLFLRFKLCQYGFDIATWCDKIKIEVEGA